MERKWRKDELALLAGTALFRGLPQEELPPLLAEGNARRCRVRKGEVIYAPRQYQQSLGILLTGSALVTKGTEGAPPLVVSMLRRGDLFGAAALFNDEPDFASTITARADCSLVLFSQARLTALLKASPLLALNYIRYLSSRIRVLAREIDCLVAGSGEKKLVYYLLSCMDENQVVQLGCSLTELSRRLHMGRASLYRALDRLEEEGILVREGREIIMKRTEGCAE